jgi:hypothetical protein
MIGAVKDKRNEGGARRNDIVAEQAGDVVAERRCAHFRDGKAAGGDDEDWRAEFVGGGAQDKFRGAVDFGDARVEKNLDVSGAAFEFEKISDFGGGIVAEELAEGFFVVGDAMLFEECKKIGGRVTCQGGFCEVGIGGEEIFRGGMEIGEVAAAPAGD